MNSAVVPLHAEEDGVYTPRRERSRYASPHSSVDTAGSVGASRNGRTGNGLQGSVSGSECAKNVSGSHNRVNTIWNGGATDSGDTVLTDSSKHTSLRSSGNGTDGQHKASTLPSDLSAAAAATKVPPHAPLPPLPPPPPVRPLSDTASTAKSPASAKPSPLVYKKPSNPREALSQVNGTTSPQKSPAVTSAANAAPTLNASTPQRSVSPQKVAQPPLLPSRTRSPASSTQSSLSMDNISNGAAGRSGRPPVGIGHTSANTHPVQAAKPQLASAVQSFNERLISGRPSSSVSSPSITSRSPTPRTTPAATANNSAIKTNGAAANASTARPASARPPAVPVPPRSSGISPTLTNSTNTTITTRSSRNSTAVANGGATSPVPHTPASSPSPGVHSNGRGPQQAAPSSGAPKSASSLPPVATSSTPLTRATSDATSLGGGSSVTTSMNQQRRVTVPIVRPQRTVPTAGSGVATTPTAQNGPVMTHPQPMNTNTARPAVPRPATHSATSGSTNNNNNNGNRVSSSSTPARTTPPGTTTNVRLTPPSSASPVPPRPSASAVSTTTVAGPPPTQRRVPLEASPANKVSTTTTTTAATTAQAPVRSAPSTNTATTGTAASPTPARTTTGPHGVNTPKTATQPTLSSTATPAKPSTASAAAATTPATTTSQVPRATPSPGRVQAPAMKANMVAASSSSTSSPKANHASSTGDEDVIASAASTKRNLGIKPVSPSNHKGSLGKPLDGPSTPATASPTKSNRGPLVTAPARGGRQRGPVVPPPPSTSTAAAPKPGPSLLRTQRSSDELTDATNSSLELSVDGNPTRGRASPAASASPGISTRTTGASAKTSTAGCNTNANALLDSPKRGVGLPSFGTKPAAGVRADEEEEEEEREEKGGYVSDGPKTPRAAKRESRRNRSTGNNQRKHTSSADKKHKKKPAVSSAEELATLAQYLDHEELNLSMSTFNSVQVLAQSHTLRVLNLKGSTLSSEGLRGLGNVPTLQSLCVSHMRKLHSLVPLITTAANTRCALQEIDAQCTPLDDKGIQGLEKLPRLAKLDLSMTTVTDVSILSASRSLRELYVSVTRLTNAGIVGLEKVPTLTTLNIARTKVTSIVNITRSHSIATLILYSCKVDDAGLQGVQHMPRLTTLDVSTTKVTNLSILETSTSLKSIKAQWLALKNCCDIIQERRQQMDRLALESSGVLRSEQEAGYSGLAKIPTLESIDLSFNTVRSVSSLCESRSLRRLILRRTRVDNKGIENIDKLSRTLEELVVTNITDGVDESEEEMSSLGSGGTTGGVSAGMLSSVLNLAGLAHLSSLDLSYTDVFDLRMLQVLKHLKELFIVETLVTVDGLRGIELIPTLEVLDVSQTSVMSLQFLVAGAKALRKIVVRSNRNVRGFRLGHLENLPRLEHLDMSDTVVEDVRLMWTAAWDLKELVWRWKERYEATGLVAPLECWVTSERLSGINKLPNLALLDLSNSSLHNLAFLEGSRSLRRVVLDGSRLLRDDCVASLAKCRELDTLDLSNIPHLTSVLGLRSCVALKELRLANTGVTSKGIEGITQMPQMKALDIANTPAEEEMLQAMGEKAVTSSHVNGVNMNNSFSYTRPQSRMMEESSLADVSMMDMSATPAQFRVPRRRRVSFVASDGPSSKERKENKKN